jgi:hypothetical protein
VVRIAFAGSDDGITVFVAGTLDQHRGGNRCRAEGQADGQRKQRFL